MKSIQFMTLIGSFLSLANLTLTTQAPPLPPTSPYTEEPVVNTTLSINSTIIEESQKTVKSENLTAGQICYAHPQKECSIANYAYFISVQDTEGHHLCGGTLYENNTVITSGKCCSMLMEAKSKGNIITGSKSLRKGEQMARVLDMKIHEKFDKLSGDVCIIRTLDYLLETEYTQFARLPDDENEQCEGGVILGYAIQSIRKKIKTSHLTDELKCSLLNVKNETNCLTDKDAGTKDVICTELCGNDQDACYLDEGAPLICNNKIYGIVSHGDSCMKPNTLQPIVKLANYKNWIDNDFNNVKPDVRAGGSSSSGFIEKCFAVFVNLLAACLLL